MRRGSAAPRGFTLIELVAVLAVVGLVAGLVAPKFASGIGTIGVRSASRQVAGLCRYGRDRAVSTRTVQRLAIDLDGGTMWLEESKGKTASPAPGEFERLKESFGRTVPLPRKVRVKAVASLGGTAEGGVAYVWFFPDMRQPTSAVYLEREDGGRVYTVEVAALTGRVRIYAVEHDPLAGLHAS